MVFARRTGEEAIAAPLTGEVERWLGKPGPDANRQTRTTITDTSASSVSPYAGYSRQGASIVPRCLFFVEEAENPAIVQAGQTVTVNPRRGSHDKDPWRSLDLTVIAGQTIESRHVYDIHLGETLVPYATLKPLKAVLPMRRGDGEIPNDPDGVGGIDLGGVCVTAGGPLAGCGRRIKGQSTSLAYWGRLDFHRELSSQVEWNNALGDRPVRVVYSSSGVPTAALLHDDNAVVDFNLFWITCRDTLEAYYLLAVVNSDTLAESVNKYNNRKLGWEDAPPPKAPVETTHPRV